MVLRLVHSRFPGLASRAPALELCTLPTRVHRLEAASRATGADLWIKRDGETHRELGGSKLRALEFLLGEPRRRPLVAYGPEASGWLLDLAHFAKALPLDVEILTFPMPGTAIARHKAELLRAEAGPQLARGRDFLDFALRFLCAWIRTAGGGRELAPPGGSSAISTIGYVNAALELAEQVRRGDCPEPDVVVAPLGSGGLVTGLALGLAIADLRSELVGVSVAPRVVSNRLGVIRLLLQTAWALDLHDPRMATTRITHAFKGTYALPTAAGEAAVRMLADDGVELDPAYSSKTAAAALSIAREKPGKKVLFWHTYAAPRLSQR